MRIAVSRARARDEPAFDPDDACRVRRARRAFRSHQRNARGGRRGGAWARASSRSTTRSIARCAGPDHPFAAEPQELHDLVAHIRDTEAALGDGVKRGPSAEESEEMYAKARRSVVAAAAIPAGHGHHRRHADGEAARPRREAEVHRAVGRARRADRHRRGRRRHLGHGVGECCEDRSAHSTRDPGIGLGHRRRVEGLAHELDVLGFDVEMHVLGAGSGRRRHRARRLVPGPRRRPDACPRRSRDRDRRHRARSRRRLRHRSRSRVPTPACTRPRRRSWPARRTRSSIRVCARSRSRRWPRGRRSCSSRPAAPTPTVTERGWRVASGRRVCPACRSVRWWVRGVSAPTTIASRPSTRPTASAPRWRRPTSWSPRVG